MSFQSRRGVTLVELLVVVFVLVAITAAALQVYTPSAEERRVREAARGVNTFFSVARARAISSGRPVGVQIRRLPDPAPGDPNRFSLAGVNLVYVEMPEPYSGSTTLSTIELHYVVAESDPPNGVYSIEGRPGLSGPGFDTRFVKPNDFIRFGHQGYLYQITNATSSRIFARINTGGGPLPWPPSTTGWSTPVPFSVIRQPAFIGGTNEGRIRAGSADTYELPRGTVIDLSASAIPGLDWDGNTDKSDINADITIMFSPSGGIAGVYGPGESASGAPVLGTVHLMIGFGDRFATDLNPATADLSDNRENFRHPDALWVSIGSMTGQVNTFENAPLAQAVAEVAGGSISAVRLLDPGEGYSSPPQVVFLDGGGSGAAATVTGVNPDGSLQGINVTSGGSGYFKPPQVVIRSPDSSFAQDLQLARRYARGGITKGGH